MRQVAGDKHCCTQRNACSGSAALGVKRERCMHANPAGGPPGEVVQLLHAASAVSGLWHAGSGDWCQTQGQTGAGCSSYSCTSHGESRFGCVPHTPNTPRAAAPSVALALTLAKSGKVAVWREREEDAGAGTKRCALTPGSASILYLYNLHTPPLCCSPARRPALPTLSAPTHVNRCGTNPLVHLAEPHTGGLLLLQHGVLRPARSCVPVV